MAGFGCSCIETQKVCTLNPDKNPIVACGAESLHSKRQHIFHTAHAAGDKHISSSAVPPAPFTPYLPESTGHKVMLYKGKHQVMLLQVWYISPEEAPVSQSSIIISFLHRWHLDPWAQRYLFTRSWNCKYNISGCAVLDKTVKHFILLPSELSKAPTLQRRQHSCCHQSISKHLLFCLWSLDMHFSSTPLLPLLSDTASTANIQENSFLLCFLKFYVITNPLWISITVCSQGINIPTNFVKKTPW